MQLTPQLIKPNVVSNVLQKVNCLINKNNLVAMPKIS